MAERATTPAGDGLTGAEVPSLGALVRAPVIAGLAVIALFFGGFGTWASLAPLAGAAIASGIVSPDTNRKTVQHLEGGIISQILVQDGDVVQEGDPLVILETTQASAAFELLQGQYRSYAATQARLLSEQAGAETLEFPDWLEAERSDPETARVLEGQQNLFEKRREAHQGRKAILEKRIDQLDEEIAGIEAEIRAQSRQLALLGEEIAAKQKLVDKGLQPRPQLLALQRQQAVIQGEKSQNIAAIARARQSIGEARLQIVNLDTTRLNEVADEMAEVRDQMGSIRERLRAQRDVLNRTTIVAPVPGIIVQKRFHTTAGVVGPGEPILDIVPLNDDLLIDARVRPTDIDVVRPGLEAQVHLLAYSQRNLPQIVGTVRSVSADALVDPSTGERYYRARVEVPGDQLDLLGEDIKLSPGMPTEVLIMTGARTMMGYLLQPFFDSLRRSFRED